MMSTQIPQANIDLVTEVFHKLSPLLKTYFHNRLRSHHEIDDYMQELYCRLLIYKKADEVEDLQKFVFTIAVNLMRDRARRVNTRLIKKMVSLDEVQDLLDHDYTCLEKNFIYLETLEKVSIIISQISPNTGKAEQAFYMNKLEGYKQSEIALKLGVTVSAIEKYMMAVKRELKVIDYE